MPELLADFENGCFAYFAWKDVAEDKQVMKIAWGLQDAHIQVWYRTNRDTVNAASFTTFMTSVRNQWLPTGWEHNVRCLILSWSQQNLPVTDWIRLLESINAVLIATTSHLTSAHLRAHIKTHLHANTQTAAQLAETHLILDYATYIHAIKLIDDARIRQAHLLQEAITRMHVPAMSSCHDKPAHTPASSTPTVDCLPALTTTERTLLQDNEGCFKCRVPFADHVSHNCPTGFPDKTAYKPLTAADIAIAKCRKIMNKPSRAAAVLPVAEDKVVPTAVIIPSAVLGDGSDSKCVDALFSSPHFFVDVIIGGSSLSQPPVHVLIDHGCNSVLISPKLVELLGFTPRKLPKLKSVIMAVEEDERKETVFREYVNITIVSANQSWSSHSCRAIIAHNLCAPLILGNIFFSYNHFVIDHKLRTCVDKTTSYDLLNLPNTSHTIIKPRAIFGPELRKKQKVVIADIKSLFPKTKASLDEEAHNCIPCPIAAIQDHVQSLVTEEQLRLKDAKFKDHYLDLFPPDIPDVAKLPEDILMSIKLRDKLKPMVAWAYLCPRKYREGWKTLIEQHLAAGCIHPPNSDYVSPAFIMPKSDPNVLPCWVNDY